jgi:hypothetical protein
MDRKQSVDDILSEIKRKKAGEKGKTGDVRPPRPVREGTEAESAKPLVESLNSNINLDDKGLTPTPEHRHTPAGETSFKLDKKSLDMKLEQETAPEPASVQKADFTDFEGHVRPLTERAKISAKDKYLNLGKPQQGEDEPVQEKPAAPVREREIFAPSPPVQEQRSIDETREHTRMLPRMFKNPNTMGTGRELKLEDIRKMDFSAIASAPYTEGYYEDEEEHLRRNPREQR